MMDGFLVNGEDILKQRRTVYEAAKAKNPERWSTSTRDWTLVDEVWLNPEKSGSDIQELEAESSVS